MTKQAIADHKPSGIRCMAEDIVQGFDFASELKAAKERRDAEAAELDAEEAEAGLATLEEYRPLILEKVRSVSEGVFQLLIDARVEVILESDPDSYPVYIAFPSTPVDGHMIRFEIRFIYADSGSREKWQISAVRGGYRSDVSTFYSCLDKDHILLLMEQAAARLDAFREKEAMEAEIADRMARIVDSPSSTMNYGQWLLGMALSSGLDVDKCIRRSRELIRAIATL